jgi:hypothetical protein
MLRGDLRSGLKRTAIGLLPLVFSAVVAAQGSVDAPRSGPMRGAATRAVSQYLDRERTLEAAIERRDLGAIDAMLADGFALRTPLSPDPLARDALLGREAGAQGKERQVRDLWTQEVDDLAIVSFLLDPGPGGATVFVTDVWRTSSGKLVSRLVSQPMRASQRPSRPTGRE